LEEPVACLKGHLFCKTCIIENLVLQKNEIKKKLKKWKEDSEKREKDLKDKHEKERNKILFDNLKRNEDGIEEVEDDKTTENLIAVSDDKIEKFKMVEDLKEKKNYIPVREKAELVKNCFWIPEQTPEADNKNSDRPSE
jgi:nitric oxide synthase-interacting protein